MTQNEKRAIANIHSWERSSYTDLYKAYETASPAKWRAWYYCKDLCAKMNGSDLKVISKNTFIFTAGFQFTDPETGVIRFMYITPSYDTAVDMQ